MIKVTFGKQFRCTRVVTVGMLKRTRTSFHLSYERPRDLLTGTIKNLYDSFLLYNLLQTRVPFELTSLFNRACIENSHVPKTHLKSRQTASELGSFRCNRTRKPRRANLRPRDKIVTSQFLCSPAIAFTVTRADTQEKEKEEEEEEGKIKLR